MTSTSIAKTLTALLLAAATPLVSARPPGACARQGTPAVEALHRDWIMTWDKQEGSPPMNARRQFERFYDWTVTEPEGRFYDDFDPERRVFHTPAAYLKIWEAPFSALRSAAHKVTREPAAVSSGRLAASSLEFVARLVQGDGQAVGIRTQSSLTWRCGRQGWRIIREHNSSTLLSPAQLDAEIPAR